MIGRVDRQRLVQAITAASELSGARWEDCTILFAAETLLQVSGDIDALCRACRDAAVESRGRLAIGDIVRRIPKPHASHRALPSHAPMSRVEARRSWARLIAALDQHARDHHGASDWREWLARPLARHHDEC